MKRKFDLMYEMFGRSTGKCKDCQHYTTYRYHNKPYRKCELYGVTCSEATDWKASADACGLFPDKEYNGCEVVRLVRGGALKIEQQIDGQMNLIEFVGGKE